MPSTDHRPDGVADDPLAAALRAVPVAAPLDDWSATVARHRRHRRRQRAATVGTSALVLLLVVSVAAVLVGEDDDALPVQAGDPTTVAPDEADTADISAVTWTPTPQDARLLLVVEAPTGPIPEAFDPPGLADGQVVDLTGPAELFDPNDRPLQCVVVDGRESCDPLPARGAAALGLPVLDGDRARVAVRIKRWVLAPSGWQDCTDPLVACRLVQHGQDGANRATGRLDVSTVPSDDGPAGIGEGPAADGAGPPQVDVGEDGLVADGGPTPIDLSGPAAAVRRPGTWLQPEVTLCRFMPAPTVVGASILPVDCQDVGALPTPLDALADRGLPRTMYGIAGWHDCADGTCFVRVSWGITDPTAPLPPAMYDPAIGAGLVRFDPSVPEQRRPVLTIEPAGPNVDQQVVTVTGTGFSAGSEVQLGQCNAGDPANGTDPWGQAWEDCRYAGPLSIPVDGDGGYTVEVPMIREHLVLGIPGSGIDCALEPAGTCYLGYTPGKGYAEPMASVPLTFTP